MSFFLSELLLDNSTIFILSRTIYFEAPMNRLSGTVIVECLEIIDVGCNLKQSDGWTVT